MTRSLMFFVLIAVCMLNTNLTAQIIKPCSRGDDVCITNSARMALPKIVAGIPSAGVPPSDPMFVEYIDGNLSILKYNFTESTMRGLGNCDINNVKLDLDRLTLKADLVLHNLQMSGTYAINGRLIVLPVEGYGEYAITCNRYDIGVTSQLKISPGKDGIKHLTIKSFQLTLEAKDGMVFKLDNLFNGRKDLSDQIHKFANQNWREVAQLVQEPTLYAIIRKLVSNINKYMKTVPFEELVVA